MSAGPGYIPRVSLPVAAAALAALTACSAGPEGPVELRLSSPPAETSFRASYRQDIDWGQTPVSREYGARYTMRAGSDTPGGAPATLDSLAITVHTPHGSQSLDTRALVGESFGVSVPPRGGPATFTDEPVFEMPGLLEGRVALSRLVDYGFPPLPDEPVRPGDVWTARHGRPHAEGQIIVRAEIETEMRFAGWETVGNVECVRLEGRIRGTAAGGAPQARGPEVEYDGDIDGSVEWLLDPATGVVLRATVEEVSEGVLAAGRAETPMRQVTRIRITAARRAP
ncbi:MAG: hypothetical protein R3195_13575 [Gemmatimonadota bacterium]|nr:hypothetical protein [Gemmatimonadota bacterium]